MERPAQRLTAVLGVTRAMLATLDPTEAVTVLVAEFGWDAAFQSLAMLRGDTAATAFGIAWERLVLLPFERELDLRP
ncbi:MAG TPA: hypothetical protein VHF25_10430 [Nitriliruptorales bacterium]|nr:hypothetical protein [Nitriliruptorales bacterium]